MYAARASRLSGHWIGDRLKAIVSVNAEGFDVAGDPEAEFIASAGDGFAFRTTGEELELVAGLGAPERVTSMEQLTPNEVAKLREMLSAGATTPAVAPDDGAEQLRARLATAITLSLASDD